MKDGWGDRKTAPYLIISKRARKSVKKQRRDLWRFNQSTYANVLPTKNESFCYTAIVILLLWRMGLERYRNIVYSWKKALTVWSAGEVASACSQNRRLIASLRPMPDLVLHCFWSKIVRERSHCYLAMTALSAGLRSLLTGKSTAWHGSGVRLQMVYWRM